jgi:hypothetical protein
VGARLTVNIRIVAAVSTLGVLVAACTADSLLVDWDEQPLEQVIYAIDREPETVRRPTVFNMLERRGLAIEDASAQGRWDFALARENGEMVLLPPNSLGVISRAAIATIPGTQFADVRQAPADTLLYSVFDPVPVRLGNVYVIRTHQQFDVFGQFCFFFGKIEPLEMDAASGVMRFVHDVSPICNDLSLVPPN